MHNKTLRTLFSKTTAIIVVISIFLSSCPHIAFATEMEEGATESTTYVVSENGKVVDTYVDTTPELNNDNIESEPIEENNNGTDSIGAAEETSQPYTSEQTPSPESLDDELEEQGPEELTQETTANTIPEVLDNQEQFPEPDLEPELSLFEQLLLTKELKDILDILKDESLIAQLNEFTENEIKELIEYLVKEFADEKDKEKLTEALILISELKNALVEDDETESPVKEIPEVENATNIPEVAEVEETPETEDTPENKNQSNVNEKDFEMEDADEVAPGDTDEAQEETDKDAPSLYKTALGVIDFEELYFLMTNTDNLVVMQEWTTEEIDSVILKALGYDDERLDEVLIILYELPNAPDMFATYEIPDDGRIYFDLAAGDVTLKNTTYSGYVFVDGVATQKTGTHSTNNQYYVYQSNPNAEVAINAYGVPQYTRVANGGTAWGNYITNNTDIPGVVSNWANCAQTVNRVATGHKITVTTNSTYNLTIDNLWSSYISDNTSRTTGGIGFDASSGGVLNITMLGDNRFGNIFYSSSSNTARIIFDNGEESLPATLTCASFDGKSNHYNSVIGGNDNTRDAAHGITINGGIIWAAAPTADNCTAIGGGGNGYGKVYINGGTVTTVVHSSGASIGGGIGESSQGGDALVNITGGNVYAYNFGYVSNMSGTKYFIPGAAIGGGSSCKSDGNATTNITISGGYVYAQSLGGAAIGGGSSTMKKGGAATVTISGSAVVEAQSVSGTATNGASVPSGVSIGGGTAGAASSSNGGDITLNINGGRLFTGSIGGGGCNNTKGSIGSGTVIMTDGQIRGQIVMGAGAAKNTFTMTGGTIDNSTTAQMSPVFVKPYGGAVYLEAGNATINGGTIKNCNSQYGGAAYVEGGDFYMQSGTIMNCTATNGGAVYVNNGNMIMSGGSIRECEADYGGAAYINGGVLTINNGYIEENQAIDGGAIYMRGGNINVFNGVVNNNNANHNGGAFYVETTTQDVNILIEDGQLTNNTAGNHGGAIGANAENNKSIKLMIGSSECDGDVNINHKDGACPQIANNTSSQLGGAFCLHGDALSIDIYCGHITGNIAVRNPGSNSLNQSGGVVTVYHGTIDPGLMVGGGEYIDNRLESHQITIKFWGNYEGAPESPRTVQVTNGITISFPIDSYGRDGHFLTGWATSPDATGMYVPANGKYTLDTESSELNFYAVWDVDSTYIVYIPDTLEIDDSQTGTMDIRADLFYFLELSTLDIIVTSDFVLSNEQASNVKIPFSLYSSEFGASNKLVSGGLAATFQYNNVLPKTLTAILDTTNTRLSCGNYTGLLTFVVDYYIKDDT